VFIGVLVSFLRIACSSFCFHIGEGVVCVCVLLPGVHSLQCSEYWVMCINVCAFHV
jgi:hypothetical protein